MAEKEKSLVEVHVAVTEGAREIVLQMESTQEEIGKAVNAALASGKPLELTDEKGKKVIVPSDKIGFVEIGASAGRRVGFGAA
jgi:hypothetical protein